MRQVSPIKVPFSTKTYLIMHRHKRNAAGLRSASYKPHHAQSHSSSLQKSPATEAPSLRIFPLTSCFVPMPNPKMMMKKVVLQTLLKERLQSTPVPFIRHVGHAGSNRAAFTKDNQKKNNQNIKSNKWTTCQLILALVKRI